MALYDSPSGPCAAWTSSAALRCDTAGVDPALIADAIAASSFVLWALGGRRHGPCTTTIRPCRADLVPRWGSWPEWGHGFTPQLVNGVWYNVCGHRSSCGCSELSEISLPWGPVSAIGAVKLDGVTLVAGTDYRLDDRRRLVRLPATAAWPACQDISLADTQPGTFSIALTHGVPLDDMAPMAAAELACEFIAKWTSGKCRLPERVQTITRQSVTWTVLDPQQFLKEGRTGLYFVDLWLRAVNPTGQTEESKVWSVEDHLAGGRARRVGT